MDTRTPSPISPALSPAPADQGSRRLLEPPLRDVLGRGLDDLRISVIDRCNFRCTFCMPAEQTYEFLPRAALLSFEEITRLARIFASLGVKKIRLTGGEPLLRRDLEHLIEMLAAIEGIEDLALTTNGLLLEKKARALAGAGLRRVTVSLESLRDEVYGRINGVGQPVAPILRGIEAAQQAGLEPVKVNVVVQRGVNDDEVVELARQLGCRGCVVRFIEYMDVGTLNGWDAEQVLSARTVLGQVDEQFPLVELPRRRAHDTALRFQYVEDSVDGPPAGLEVGAIASITEPFCGDCSRARLTSDGALHTCLFSPTGVDLKAPLRRGASDAELRGLIEERWRRRTDRYSEERAERMASGIRGTEPKIEMYRIGG
jgi:cyclic pyranopterin phosphate synthase